MLHPSLSDPTKTYKNSYSHKLLCQSSQEQLPVRGIASAYRQKCCRTGVQSDLVGVLQPTLFSLQTQQQMETDIRPQQSEPIPQSGEIQDGNTGNHQNLPSTRGRVTSVDFKDAYFHIPIQEQSRKYLRFRFQDRTYQFKALPFGLSTGPMEFTVVAKEVKLMAIHKGIRIHQYLDDWLVRAKSLQTCLRHTQMLVKICQDLGWLVNLEKIRTGAQTNLQLCRLPVRPQVRPGPTDTAPVAKSSREDTSTFVTTGLSGSSCP